MKIRLIVVGQLQTNCYLIIDKHKQEAIIIDPGDDADYISRVINDEKVKPSQIIATHGHFDHIMVAAELQLAYKIPFFIHKEDKFLIKRMNQSARYFTGIGEGIPPKINGYLEKSENIILGRSRLKIIETPGHTPGSISLYNKNDNTLFVGDLLFAGGGVGRTDFSYSSSEELNKSINIILKLPGQTTIYSGHGPETTIKNESKLHT